MARQGIARSLINLIPTEALRISRLTQISGTLRQISFVVIGGYLLVLAALGATFLFLEQQRNTLTRQNRDLSSSVEVLRETEAKLFTLKERVKIISQIAGRAEKQFTTPLSLVTNIAPAGVQINEFSVQKDTVEVTVTAQDTFVLETFLDSLSQSGSFTSGTLKNLTRGVSGFLASLELVPIKQSSTK